MPESIRQILNWRLAGNSLEQYLMAFLIFLGLLIVFKIIKIVIISRLEKIAKHTKTKIDDVVVKIVKDIQPPIYLFLAIFLALKYLTFSVGVNRIFNGALILVLVYQVARSTQVFIDFMTSKIIKKRGESGEDEDAAKEETNKFAVKNISLILKIVLWSIAFLIILSNWGINITSLIAGLGIGGIAIAFAVQNILQDIFSSFSIFIDKPFEVGDFILVDTDSGTVEKIGIKSTRIRSMQGEELIISNKELTAGRIHNYKKMAQRRVLFSFGVTYETKNDQLKKIPGFVKDIIENTEGAELNRVHFKNYGDFSLNFEVVYFIDSVDYNYYMDTQQSINLALKDKFESEGIEFAYPTQTILLQK